MWPIGPWWRADWPTQATSGAMCQVGGPGGFEGFCRKNGSCSMFLWTFAINMRFL